MDDQTGQPLAEEEMIALHYERIQKLQVRALASFGSPFRNPRNPFHFPLLLHSSSRPPSSQQLVFASIPALCPLALAHVSALDTRRDLAKHLDVVDDASLRRLATELRLMAPVC